MKQPDIRSSPARRSSPTITGKMEHKHQGREPSTVTTTHTSFMNSDSSERSAAYTAPLETLTLDDLSRVGGKNASLGEMLAELADVGVRVPGGFATTVEAYNLHLQQAELDTVIVDELDQLDVNDTEALAKTGQSIRRRRRLRHRRPAQLRRGLRPDADGLERELPAELADDPRPLRGCLPPAVDAVSAHLRGGVPLPKVSTVAARVLQDGCAGRVSGHARARRRARGGAEAGTNEPVRCSTRASLAATGNRIKQPVIMLRGGTRAASMDGLLRWTNRVVRDVNEDMHVLASVRRLAFEPVAAPAAATTRVGRSTFVSGTRGGRT